MSAVTAPASLATPRVRAAALAAAARVRVDSIDLLRGLVMVLMVLDHARMYLTEARFDPTDLAQTTPALFLTRWITHFCAPVFVFLAGTSAFLSGSRRGSKLDLARFLASRGLWLVLLELTLVNAAWSFNLRFESGVILQVIWAIGASMLALALLIALPTWAVGAFGVALIAGHNLFDGVSPESLGAFAVPWAFLHVSGVREAFGAPLFILYPLVPWVGVMAAGYAFGTLYRLAPRERRRWLLALGAALVLLFVLLRAAGAYGDPRPYAAQATPVLSFLAFLNVTKYPPSVAYVAMTLGPAFLALAAFERSRGALSRLLVTLGRVPLFFYMLHIVLVHAMALALGVAQGHPAAAFLRDFRHRPDGFGFGLPAVYAAWLLALALLYPGSRWFAGVKRRSRSAWLSYL
jgi:uncharacterized membrane protein